MVVPDTLVKKPNCAQPFQRRNPVVEDTVDFVRTAVGGALAGDPILSSFKGIHDFGKAMGCQDVDGT